MIQNPDYLLIGHVAHDETPQGPKLGGTVSYAGCAANALGAHVAIVTSAARDEVVLGSFPPGIELHVVEAPHSTIFVNLYEGDKRRQIVRGHAQLLSLADVPEAWRGAAIVHLGPLDDEVDPALARAFPNALVAAGPQGWMRTWDAEGTVFPKPWAYADDLLPVLDVTVFSEEDIHRDATLEAHYASLARLLVVTRAANGCTVYQRGQEPFNVPAPSVPVVDATGAGDIFTGVFLVVYRHTRDVRRAAKAATHLASLSVTRVGMSGIPTPEEIRRVIDLTP
jgi:sugar/nucleoside kinase (ribokinase family)